MFNVNFTFNGHHLKIDLSGLPPECRSIIISLPNGHQAEYTLGREPGSLALDVPGLISRFLIYLDINEDLRPLTLKGYRNRLGQFGEWLVRTGAGIEEGETWLAYWASLKARDWSPYTLKGHYHILTRFSRWLFERGHLSVFPFADVRTPRLPKDAPPKAIRPEHINLMLRAAQTPRERALLMFFRDTACRAAEAVSLRWRDVDLVSRQARVLGKRDQSRPLFFKPSTARALHLYRLDLKPEHARAEAAVWWGRQGPLNYDGIYKIFKRLAARAGLDEVSFSPHAWRHAFGRDTTIRGIPTAQLQDLMGHSSIEVTKIYAQFDTDELQQAHDKYSPVDNDLTLRGNGIK